MGKVLQLKGKKFGRMTVIERYGSSSNGATWLCKCDCGNEKIVIGRHLVNGHTSSCGCIRKHGHSETKVYHIWQHMKDRCYNQNHKSYKDYGGRGIVVCDEWKDIRNF